MFCSEHDPALKANLFARPLETVQPSSGHDLLWGPRFRPHGNPWLFLQLSWRIRVSDLLVAAFRPLSSCLWRKGVSLNALTPRQFGQGNLGTTGHFVSFLSVVARLVRVRAADYKMLGQHAVRLRFPRFCSPFEVEGS